MAKGPGNTIIVAGGGGAGGSRGGGGSSGSGNGGGSSGGGKSPLSGGKLKMDDKMFWSIATVLGLAAGAAYIYTARPDLVHEFLGNITKLGQPAQPAVPLQQPGQVTNDVIPQATTPADPNAQQQQQLQYPYPQQSTGQQPFQYPQQNTGMQQMQPYQPTGYGGGGAGAADISTSYNPMFGQNSNMPTSSFAARRVSQLEYDSSDGMLTRG